MKRCTSKPGVRLLVITTASTLLFGTTLLAQVTAPDTLKNHSVPAVTERITGQSLTPHYVVDEEAAIALGKALFWDMQVGSDGQSCGSCHFHAGADSRAVNQLSPGLNGGNGVFDPVRSTGNVGPNQTLTLDDYPFHALSDPSDRDSDVLFDTDDVASSQGVFPTRFNDIILGSSEEDVAIEGGGLGDPLGFHVGGTNVRRVEPRNTPTVINAALNHRNFWDGRANNIFNGVDPFGRRNEDARILQVSGSEGDGSAVEAIQVEFENSSLASQAVGPPLSDFEMAAGGKSFPKLGKKMLTLTPLAMQQVAADDSVLASRSNFPAPGLNETYLSMIQTAFDARFWDSGLLFDADQNVINAPALGGNVTEEFTLAESNFAFFWGIAIQMYEATLISDDSPFDRFTEGTETLSDEAMHGLSLFMNEGSCMNCHATSMFTKASTLHLVDEAQEEGLVERMNMASEQSTYGLKGSLKAKNNLGPGRFEIRVDAQGEPWDAGGAIAAGPGSGTIEIDWADPNAGTGGLGASIGQKGSVVTCEYIVDGLTLNLDGNPATADVAITGLFSDGPAGCPDRISIYYAQGPNGDLALVDGDGQTLAATSSSNPQLRLRIMTPALYDNGFYNIAVRPPQEDIGLGAEDPFGHPLSFARQYKQQLLGQDVPDPFSIDPCTFEIPFHELLDGVFFPGGFDGSSCGLAPSNVAANMDAIQDLRVAVEAAFKVPTLRNVELTGPFFHNGGQATLRQVVEFYNRGGDFASENSLNMDPDVRPLGFSDQDIDDIVAFLETLTDDRVRKEMAPFDRPQLFVPLGHPGDHLFVSDSDADGQADATFLEDSSVFLELPAVGAGGRPDAGLPDLGGFLED